MAQKITPMRKQYLEMKEKCPDCLLFFRLGDFYEMFDEDARIASKVLDLTLTTRDRNKDIPQEEKVPMCGVPYHAANSYIKRLIDRGHKVAVCDQLEDPALTKGLVKRDVIRVITPGTVTESSMLEEKKNNCDSVGDFVDRYCTPNMLIKLRQGVGRLIRCESDTGVVSILDPRAISKTYSGKIGQALHKFPKVDSVQEIECFMRGVKNEEYYGEKKENRK